MITRAQEAVASTQKRLDDEDGVVWSYAELLLYIKDGYNELCRRTKCLFDLHVIENVPQTGNWGTDLERHLAEQTPGMGLTDEKLQFTAEHERDTGVTGMVGGSTEGPTRITKPPLSAEDFTYDSYENYPSSIDLHLFQSDQNYAGFNLPERVPTGRLPDETVDVLRVTWDELELQPENSATMRQMDTQYERREGGDPRHFVMDKDGLLTIRLVPPARGDADYRAVMGSWGTMNRTMNETGQITATVHGSWGILREVEGAFPAGGPHGTPTRRHPAAKNIVVEIARLGRSLDSHAFEIPSSYVKYPIFWAMYRALKKAGPGQDLKLAKHYLDRFVLGAQRMETQLRRVHKERVLRMGAMGESQEPFAMGDPTLPYPYGPNTGRIRE